MKILSVTAAVFLLLATWSAPAQNSGSGFWSGLGRAMSYAGSGTIAGNWQGGKSERDSQRGGYINASWIFTFDANGEYKETVSIAGRQVIYVEGRYTLLPAQTRSDPSITNSLMFEPGAPHYAEDADMVGLASFPIPTNHTQTYYVNFFSVSDGRTMMLESAATGSDSWEMKNR